MLLEKSIVFTVAQLSTVRLFDDVYVFVAGGGNGLGDGVGDGLRDGLGDGLRDVFGDGLGDVLGDGLGDVLGDVLGDGLGDVLGDELGEGDGDGVTPLKKSANAVVAAACQYEASCPLPGTKQYLAVKSRQDGYS